MRGIVFNAHGGGVSVCVPTKSIFESMGRGGYWSEMPHGFIDTQIERNIQNGVEPCSARKFCHALAFGGLTEAEVYAVIRDRDCLRDGVMHDLVDLHDLPDNWFRGAWARGHNGGPVYVDLKKARDIQWGKIHHAIEVENSRRAKSLFGKPEIKFQKTKYRSLIMRARDEDELRKIWPEELGD